MSCALVNLYSNDLKNRAGNDLIKTTVDSYLRRRCYMDTDYFTKPENVLNQNSVQMTIGTTIVKDGSSINSITYRPCANTNDISFVEEQFVKLKTWITELKEGKCKSELHQILFPFLCHLYLELVCAGHDRQETSKFLIHHQQLDKHRDIIEELSQILTTQDIDFKPLVKAFRSCKYEFKISSTTMTKLENYLRTENHPMLLQVLQTWFDVEVTESDKTAESELEPYDELSDDNADYLEGLNQQSHGDQDMQNLKKCLKSLRAMHTPPPALLLYTMNNSEGICCAKVSHSGKLLASGYTSSLLKLWSVSESKLSAGSSYYATVNLATKTPTQVQEVLEERHTSFRGHCGPVTGVEFLPDSDIFLSVSHDSTMRAWRLTDHSPAAIYRGHNYPVWCVASSSLGVYIATGSHDRTARLWSLDRTFPIRMFAGHSDDVNCLQFHPNGNYLATGSADHSVRLWSVTDGNLVRIYSTSSGSILSLAFSPNGLYIASAGEDRRVQVWDLASGGLLAELKAHSLPVTALTWSMDSSILASASLDGTVCLWNSAVHFKSPLSECSENATKYTTNCSSILSLQSLLRGNLVAVGSL